MQAEIEVSFEEAQRMLREQKAPIFVRRMGRKNRVNIIKRKNATDEEVFVYLFGEQVAKQILAQEHLV